MLVLTIRKFDLTSEYIEIKHKSGDTIKICLTDIISGKALIGHDAKKEEFHINRKKIYIGENCSERISTNK